MNTEKMVNSAREHGMDLASKVGDNGIKADTWYSLDAAGEFVEEA